jgi:hypothetical protein
MASRPIHEPGWNHGMVQHLPEYRESISDLCRRHGVRRLDVFGSATHAAARHSACARFGAFALHFPRDWNRSR